LVDESIIELFQDLPPHSVEISLYGATPETYEKVTGVIGSFSKCLTGIQRLLDANINLVLKTILMTYNRHEFFGMKEMAEGFGVGFRFDAAIFPRLDGDKKPLELRVSPEEAVEKEMADGDRLQQWKDYHDKVKGFSVPDNLYNCGTGLTSFHINANGMLQPCLMVSSLQYDLLNGSFLEGWRDVMPRIREKKAGAAKACTQCEKMSLLMLRLMPAMFIRIISAMVHPY